MHVARKYYVKQKVRARVENETLLAYAIFGMRMS